MDELLTAFNGFLGLKGKKDDDFCDRLSSRYTMVVLLVSAAVTTFYQFSGYPIMCWAPPHFTEAHMKFTNNYCWVKNTYYLPYAEEIPREDQPEERQMVVYYQWVPFLLLVQALFFHLPSLVWNGLNQKAGVDSDSILAAANMLSKASQEENREGILYLVSIQINRFLNSRAQHQTTGGSRYKQLITSLCSLCGRRFSSYLVTLYLFTKILYITNIFVQLFVLNFLLGTKYNAYGFSVMRGLISDTDWHDSPGVTFPRITMCDFPVRRLGNVHRYTVQCTLPLNLFNEKIYVFLWFWFVFVLVVTVFGFFQWLFRAIMSSDRLVFIQNHLTKMGKLESEGDKVLSQEFVANYLRQDGTFVLRLISHNTNNITTSDIVALVWDDWKDKYCKKGLLDGDGRYTVSEEEMAV